MILALLTILLSFANVDVLPEDTGTIHGVVVNGTQRGEPIGGIDVVLRAAPDGELVPLATTQIDIYGKFVFEGVPLEPTIAYLPGADRHGVHYPGQRVQLDLSKRIARVTIVVFDAVEAPCPLVAMRHEINVKVEQGVLEVTETMLVTNPSRTTYVGEPVDERPPITLRLSIPENFDRVTFASEFYGRRFRIVERQPVTDIPWPPGDRELTFTYRIPLEGSGGVFRRPLDLPCSNLLLRVHGEDAEQVSCNLPSSSEMSHNVVFASVDEQLPTGYTIELQLGRMPFPWMQYARWGSLFTLAALGLATIVVLQRRDALSSSAGRNE